MTKQTTIEKKQAQLEEKIEKGEIFYNKDIGEIIIPFSTMMDFDIDIEYMRFSLSDKRVYKNLAPRIAENLNEFFEKNSDIKWQFLYVKSKILEHLSNSEKYEEDEFVEDVLTIFEDSVMEDIKSTIDAVYTENLDEKSLKVKNKNIELQLTDHHAKVIQYSALSQRIISPIITDYVEYNFDKRERRKSYFKQDEALMMEIFTRIIKKFDNGSDRTLNKIFRFINARVTQTRSSDAPMWAYLQNMAKNLSSETAEQFRKVIVSVIPKLKEDRNVVSFIHSVLRKSLKYLFTFNYPISYSPVDVNKVDKDGLTEFEKININMVKHDEFFTNLSKVSIQYEIENLKKLYHIEIDQKTLKYYSDNLDINNVQKEIVFYTMAKYFGGIKNLNFLNSIQYVELCLISSEILRQRGFDILPDIILSNPDASKERRVTRNKEFFENLQESTKFERIHNDIFSYSKEKLYETNEFMKLIATIKTNPFHRVKDGVKVEVDNVFLADEVMDMVLLI